jgi:hypothetical protein
MWCTAADLLALHRHVMKRPAEWLRPEGQTPNNHYGLGIDVAGDGQIIGHSGGNHGFVSWMGGSGDGVHRVAVLTNGNDGRLVRQAAAIISDEIGWGAVTMSEADERDPAEQVAAVVGTYAGDGHRASIHVDPARGLMLTFDDQPPMRLSYAPPDLTSPGMAITLQVIDESGPALVLRQPGLKLRLDRQ